MRVRIDKFKLIVLALTAFFIGAISGCEDGTKTGSKTEGASVSPDVLKARENYIKAITSGSGIKPIPTGAETVEITANILDKNNQPMNDVGIAVIENNIILEVYERGLTGKDGKDGKAVFKIPKGKFKVILTYNPWVILPFKPETVNLVKFAFVKDKGVTYKVAEATEFNFTENATLDIKADIAKSELNH